MAVNSIVLMVAGPEMVTEVGAPVSVNEAVLFGTVGLELQLVSVVHSAPGPVQVPSTTWARAGSGHSTANAPSHTPPSSTARGSAGRAAGAAGLGIRMTGAAVLSACGREARGRNGPERIPGPPYANTARKRGRARCPRRPRGL